MIYEKRVGTTKGDKTIDDLIRIKQKKYEKPIGESALIIEIKLHVAVHANEPLD